MQDACCTIRCHANLLVMPGGIARGVRQVDAGYVLERRVKPSDSDGQLEIEDGRIERRIRNCAIGRRNLVFTGSVRSGERLAAAYTLVNNCTILGIDPCRYLVDIITKLESDWLMSRLSERIPQRWGQHKPENKPQSKLGP